MADAPTINVTQLPLMTEAVAAQGGMQATVYNQAGQASRMPIEEIVAAGQSINANLGVLRASLTIASADVLTLNTTPVPFGLTVPTGYYVFVDYANIRATYNSAAYATNTTIELWAVGATRAQKQQNLLSFTSDTNGLIATLAGQVNSLQYVDGADIEVTVLTGDPTAGDSDITIDIVYSLIPV